MEVLTGASRVGAEAEVVTMIVDTHVATETALTKEADEMEIIIEEVVVHAHALEAQIEIPGAHEAIAVIVTIQTSSREMSVETGMKDVEQAEVPKGRAHLP